MQNKLIQGERVSYSNMNPSCKRNKNDQNNSLAGSSSSNKQLVLQRNLKRRKKKYANMKGTQHSMDLSLESCDDSPEARDRSDKRYRDILEQRNIGLPVIVETLSENLSSLSIPEVFKESEQLIMENDIFDNNPSCMVNNFKKDEACVVVAKSLNPNDNLYDNRGNGTKIMSLSKNNRRPRIDKKKSRNSNSNISPEKTSPEKQLIVSTKESEKSFDTFCEENNSFDDTNGRNDTFEARTLNKNDIPSVEQQPVRFYCIKNKVVAVMSKRARFCFTGKLVVKVIYGSIEVYGFFITTKNDPIEIYSPRGYSNVSIEVSEKSVENIESDIWTSLSLEGIDRNQKNKLVDEIEQIQPGMAVLLLSNLDNKLTRFLHVFYPFRLFPKIKNTPYYSWADTKRAETILQSNLYIDNSTCKELIIDPRIAQEVSEKMLNRWRSNEWSCTLIAGGKGVGKSTTTRYLINSLLPASKMVILMDVDPGQTECTPPGCISYSLIQQPLMGPNFTHLTTPVFQLYIGDVNVSRCITRYIEAVKMLFDKLLNCPNLSRLPIVINTMGFSQGVGWDIIMFTIKLIRPSFVVQIMSEKPKNNYIGYLSKQVVNRQELSWTTWSTNVVAWNQPCDHELFVVRSHAERKPGPGYETWNMEPYQQRELVMISYLSEIVQTSSNSTTRYDPLSLSINEVVPYVTSFASLFIAIPRPSTSASHVLNIVNGNIVALCGIDMNNNEWQEAGSGPRVLNRSPLCACYGFGIVRGVDMERKEIFINTPLPVTVMRYVNCLMGCIPVPITLLQINQQRNVPYTGGSDVLPMSREHRRGYFRMRYQKVQNNNV